MTKKDLATRLDVDPTTLRNWEKNKPELIKLINAGLLFESHIDSLEKNLDELKSMKEKASCSKLILKGN